MLAQEEETLAPEEDLILPIAACMEPLWHSTARILGLHGGRGGMKSWLLADMLLAKLVINPDLSAVCLREVLGTLDQSVKRLLDLRIKAHGLEDYFESTNKEIRCKKGSGIIVFKGLSNLTADGLKSFESFDIWLLDEGQQISAHSIEVLMPTIRKSGSQLWVAWNPVDEKVPIDAMLRGPNRRKDTLVIEVNYWDSPFFTAELRAEMEHCKSTNPEKYSWIWGGGYLKFSKATVFTNWKVQEFEAPRGAVHRFGVDWGFFPDPLVMLRGYIDGRKIYIEYEAYQRNCIPRATKALFLTVPESENYTIQCANDRPERIADARADGFDAVSVRREPNSVHEGVEFLQGYQIICHTRCRETAAELGLFKRKLDPITGDVLNEFVEGNDHCIAALRALTDDVRRFERAQKLEDQQRQRRPKPQTDAALTSHWGGVRR